MEFNMGDIDFDKIIDYFEAKLPPNEVKLIDHFIDTNTSFARWVSDAHDGWVANPIEYRKNMKKLQERMFGSMKQHIEVKKTVSMSGSEKIKAWWEKLFIQKSTLSFTVMAMIMVLMVGPIFFPPSQTPTQLYGCNLSDISCIISHEKIYQNILISQGTAIDDSVVQAITAYQNEDFKQAIPLFEELLKKELSTFQRNEITLCLGVSYIMTEKFERASGYLSPLLQSENVSYKIEAEWYNALLALQQNNSTKAIEYLNKTKDFGKHAESSNRLLKLID